MTVTAPPRPTRPDDPVSREELEALVEALIEEARQRARRRRRRNGAIVTVVALVGVAVFAVLGRSTQSQTASPAVSARLTPAAQAVTSTIAFTSTPLPPYDPRGLVTSELYVVNADGSEKRLVARGQAGSNGAWSPDGQTIAFARYGRVGELVAVFFVNADGSGQRNVTREWGLDSLPVWSPDGHRIAFMRGRGNNADIYVMNADGSGLRRLTRSAPAPAFNGYPIWSPNGRRIAFVSMQPRKDVPLALRKAWKVEVWVMNADGSGQRRLARGLPSDWSPDGQRIAFVRDRAAARAARTTGEIYVMNADGSGQRRLTHNTVNDGNPTWSPDGQKILFNRGQASSRGKLSDIYVMNADGSGQRKLTERGHGARWSPDGEKISFVSSRDGDSEIYVMNADGSGQLKVSQNPLGYEAHSHVWSPGRSG